MIRKFLSKDQTIRIATMVSTELVAKAIEGQLVSASSVERLGNVMTGACLMASQLKEKQVVGVKLLHENPEQTVYAEASYEGRVKAYCSHKAQMTLPQDDVPAGHLEVSHTIPFQAEPQRAVCELVSYNFAQNLAYYFQQSYQVPSIVALSTLPCEGGVEVSGGYIVELMPGYSEDSISLIERIQAQIPPLSKLLAGGAQSADLVSDFLINIDFNEITHEHKCEYRCSCSEDRIDRSIMSLGASEIKSMIQESRNFDVTCEFCGKAYLVDSVRLQRLLNEVRS